MGRVRAPVAARRAEESCDFVIASQSVARWLSNDDPTGVAVSRAPAEHANALLKSSLTAWETQVADYLRLRRQLGFTLVWDEHLLDEFTTHLNTVGTGP